MVYNYFIMNQVFNGSGVQISNQCMNETTEKTEIVREKRTGQDINERRGSDTDQ